MVFLSFNLDQSYDEWQECAPIVLVFSNFMSVLETHYRGLIALGMEAATYSSIFVPSILDKLPKTLRLAMTRGGNHLEWTMKDLLVALAIEVELPEEFQPIHQSARIFQSATRTESHRRTEGPATASAFYTGQQQSCAFCLDSHAHEDCGKITDVRERKRLVSKFGRCFNCIRKGHRARECRTNVSCKKCKGRHHTSLCEIETQEGRGIGVNEAVTISQNSMHVGMGNCIALQTAQVVVKESRGGWVRVLFNSASHKSFITSCAVSSLGLDPLKREWLAVNTFGKKASNSQLQDAVSVEMTTVGGGKAIQIEAFVVPEI